MIKDLNNGLNGQADRLATSQTDALRAPARHGVAGPEADARRHAGAAAVADRGAVGDTRDDEPEAEQPRGRPADEARRAAHRAAGQGAGAAGRAGAGRPGADPDDLAQHLSAPRQRHRIAHQDHRRAAGADQRQGHGAAGGGLQEDQRDLRQRHDAAGHHRRGAEEDRRPDHQCGEPAGAARRQALARRLRRSAARGAGHAICCRPPPTFSSTRCPTARGPIAC